MQNRQSNKSNRHIKDINLLNWQKSLWGRNESNIFLPVRLLWRLSRSPHPKDSNKNSYLKEKRDEYMFNSATEAPPHFSTKKKMCSILQLERQTHNKSWDSSQQCKKEHSSVGSSNNCHFYTSSEKKNGLQCDFVHFTSDLLYSLHLHCNR